MAVLESYVRVSDVMEAYKLAGIDKSERWLHDQMKKGNKIDGIKSYQKLDGYRSSPYLIILDKKFFIKIGVNIW